MTKKEIRALKWIKDIKNNAVVTLDDIKWNEPKVNPMLYAGRKEKAETIIAMFEELEQYRAIEKELNEKYHANVDIKMLMNHFIETIFEGEKHEGFCILANEDAAMWNAYQKIGTVEQCSEAVDIIEAMIERGITPDVIEQYIAFEDTCVQNGYTIKDLLQAKEELDNYAR